MAPALRIGFSFTYTWLSYCYLRYDDLLAGLRAEKLTLRIRKLDSNGFRRRSIRKENPRCCGSRDNLQVRSCQHCWSKIGPFCCDAAALGVDIGH